MKELIIQKKYDSKEVYYVIQKEFPHVNKSSLNKAFRLKDIKVNGNRVSKEFIVHENDVCKIYLNDNILYGLKENIFYAYEDDNILIAYKPRGIVSNFEGGKKQNIIYFEDIVKKEKGDNIKILNRLDTNTEGLVIFSKNNSSYDALMDAFKNNQINKEYITLVYGKLDKQSEILTDYIVKDEKEGISKVYNTKFKNSKTCITEYKVLQYIKSLNCSLVSIKLHTGRTHQIRAHMKYISHPIIGDSKYGLNEINDKFKIYSQLLFSVKYSFEFNKSSRLSYLNDVIIDVSDNVKNTLNNIINNF